MFWRVPCPEFFNCHHAMMAKERLRLAGRSVDDSFFPQTLRAFPLVALRYGRHPEGDTPATLQTMRRRTLRHGVQGWARPNYISRLPRRHRRGEADGARNTTPSTGCPWKTAGLVGDNLLCLLRAEEIRAAAKGTSLYSTWCGRTLADGDGRRFGQAVEEHNHPASHRHGRLPTGRGGHGV